MSFFRGEKSGFELLFRGFATNRVRKRGKIRCLLASIRLSEVLFALAKSLSDSPPRKTQIELVRFGVFLCLFLDFCGVQISNIKHFKAIQVTFEKFIFWLFFLQIYGTITI